MSKQAEDYIKLKPIADRFKEVAMSILDDEIRQIIKDELREQIRKQVNFGYNLENLTEEWFEDVKNQDFVLDTLKEGIVRKIG